MKNNMGFLITLVSILILGALSAHLTSLREVNTIEFSTYEIASREMELGQLKKAPPKAGESSVLLNDPNMKENWGLQSIDTQRAWNVTQGSKNVVVAVIDTGIDVNHPDLKDNLWNNPREKDNNRLGFVGDVHGWNFVDNNNDLTDNHGHGTHIAGIIGAVGGNGIGISGVSPKVSLMVLKYYDPKSAHNDNLNNTIRAFEYAIKNGADIINYSGGGTSPSPQEKAVIERAQRLGILVVAAAGNESSNSDYNKYFPADYDLDNIISVTAINQSKNVLPSSNYGTTTVDIAAPGNNIYSTVPLNKGKYDYLTGTSQATAFVSGVAALIKANNPSLKAPDIIKYLKHTGDKEPSLIGKTQFERKINTYRALTTLDQGVGITGIMADNTAIMKSDKFIAGQTINEEGINDDSVKDISDFNKNLSLHLIDSSKRKLAEKIPKAEENLN